MSRHLKHDGARTLTRQLIRSLGSVLADQSDQAECFGLVYPQIVQSLKDSDFKAERERKRLGIPTTSGEPHGHSD